HRPVQERPLARRRALSAARVSDQLDLEGRHQHDPRALADLRELRLGRLAVHLVRRPLAPHRTIPRVPPRVLIVTASVGEGHDLPARTLSAQLSDERPGVEVVTEDGLVAMGRLITAFSESGARLVFFRVLWLWDLTF